jgi:hypothetical protein
MDSVAVAAPGLYSAFLSRPALYVGACLPIVFLLFDSRLFFLLSVLSALLPLAAVVSYEYFKAPAAPNADAYRGKVIAHRGGRRVEPEKCKQHSRTQAPSQFASLIRVCVCCIAAAITRFVLALLSGIW